MGQKLGSEAKIYRNTGTTLAAGSLAGVTWSEITCLKDVSFEAPDTEVDASRRGRDRKTYLVGMTDVSISATVIHDEDDANFAALMTAKWAKTGVEIAIADGDIIADGTKYLPTTVAVFGFTQNEPLDDELTYDITLREHPDGTENSITIVSAS